MIGNFVYFLARGIMAECARKGEKMERIERERISGQEPVEAGMADGQEPEKVRPADGQEPEKTEMAGGQEPERAEMAGGQEPEKTEMAGGQEMDGQAYDRMRLEIDSLSRNEEFARVVVAVFMSRMNPTLEEIDDVKTAASEAVTNAVIHGYRQKPGIIYIEAEIHGQMFTLTVKDKGVGIGNLKKAMEPMYTSDETGERSGMGFSFMEAFMDHLEVESQLGKGTTVRMKKKIGG